MADVAPSGRLCFEVAGSPGDVALVNLTPVLAQGAGFGQLISSNIASAPDASNVNFDLGTIDPNVAAAPIGSDNKVCYVNSNRSSVDLIADHLGTIDGTAYTNATPSGAPSRKIDTRTGLGGGRISPSGRLCFKVAGSPGDVALVNLTPVLAQGPGFGQLISSNIASAPDASNVNFDLGTIDPNVAAAPIGSDNKVCYVNSNRSSVDLIADHLGTIDGTAYTNATPSGAPSRKIDTRTGLGGGRISPSGRLCFKVAGSPGDVALVNLTPVLAQGPGFGQLISSNIASAPDASNVNFDLGTIDPNVAAAPIGSDNKVCYVNSNRSSVDLIADHLGTIDGTAYTNATPSGAPSGKIDTRTGSNDCEGTFVVKQDGATAALFDISPSGAQFPPIPLPDYFPDFERLGLVVTGGCNAYYVDQEYKSSTLRHVRFDRNGVLATFDYPIPASLSTLNRPVLIGVDKRDQFAWVWAIEAGVAGAPAAVWRIPLGLGPPSRVTFAEGCGTGLCAIGTTRDGDTIYWREWDRNSGTELGIVQYTVATGQRQLLPALGDSLQTLTSPRLIVSADGSRLCAGTKSYVDLRTGQLRPLSFQCFGFDRDGRFATFFELPNGQIALGVLDSDLDTTPAVISTAPMQTFKSWPIFDSNSLG